MYYMGTRVTIRPIGEKGIFFHELGNIIMKIIYAPQYYLRKIPPKNFGSRSSSETFCRPPPPKQTPWRRPWKSAIWEGDIHKINETFEK